MQKFSYHVRPEDAGKRIDILASELSGFTRSQIHRFIEKGNIHINKQAVKTNYKAKPGDRIQIEIPEKVEELLPEDLPVELLYRDHAVVVVNKPPGLVVYPAAGHKSGTLMNAIAYHCKKLATIGSPLRPGVVHRLDKDTSGIMVVALDNNAYYSLVEQFRTRSISRQYTALIYGHLDHDRGEIYRKIGRSESDRKKMSTRVRKGKEAITAWDVIERYQNATLIQAKLGTGRTHQIRVHFASIGHPVLGDKTYGKKTHLEVKKKKIFFRRQMLHADLLGFNHPVTEEYMEFTKSVPEDIEDTIRELSERS
jgi:23S rRNA pseudouridine1911/1915/1917 synthase